ncbi:hypothetical protein GC167_05830 [bacterium]|nr:hypothetical protein [bacterium]
MLLGRKAHHSVQSCFSFSAMPMIAANHEHKVALWEESEMIDGSFMLDLEAFRRKGMLECAGYVVLKIKPATSLQKQLSDLKEQWNQKLLEADPLFDAR